MRKLEAVTKEIVDELGYLQRREMRMRDTNGGSLSIFVRLSSSIFHKAYQCWWDIYTRAELMM
jgi:hypothetical protein